MNEYQLRCKNYSPQENTNCENYQKTIAWAKANGYVMTKDISYNGYIYFEKEISLTEHYLDQYKIKLQVYDGIKMNKNPNMDVQQKEANFGSIMDKTTYSYKSGEYFSADNLDKLFTMALKKEDMIRKESPILV